MKVITKELEKCEVLLTIEFDAVKEQDMLKKEAKKLSKEVKIPGFRLGKAPYRTIVSRFGLEAIQQSVLEKSLDGLVEKALSQIEFTPISELNMEGVSWNPLTIKVKFAINPIVELSNYRDIRLDVAEPVAVSEDEINDALKKIQNRTAEWVLVERPAEVGDLVSLSVLEKEDDKLLSKDEFVEYELVDDSKSQPEFRKQLLGIAAGDKKAFDINYPDDFSNSYYAGKTISFEVEIHSVKAKEVVHFDDDFADISTDFESLDALKDNIRSVIEQRRKNEYDKQLSSEMLKKIIEEAKIEWSPLLEAQQVEDEIKNSEAYIISKGLTFDDYLNFRGMSRDEFRVVTQKKVLDRLQLFLVVGKLTELEQITCTEEEVKLYAGNIKSPNWDYISNDLMMVKTLKRLAEIAKGGLINTVDKNAEDEPETVATTNDDENSAEETLIVEDEATSTTE